MRRSTASIAKSRSLSRGLIVNDVDQASTSARTRAGAPAGIGDRHGADHRRSDRRGDFSGSRGDGQVAGFAGLALGRVADDGGRCDWRRPLLRCAGGTISAGRWQLCLPEGSLWTAYGVPLWLAVAVRDRPGPDRHARGRAGELRQVPCSAFDLGAEGSCRHCHHDPGRAEYAGAFHSVLGLSACWWP